MTRFRASQASTARTARPSMSVSERAGGRVAAAIGRGSAEQERIGKNAGEYAEQSACTGHRAIEPIGRPTKIATLTVLDKDESDGVAQHDAGRDEKAGTKRKQKPTRHPDVPVARATRISGWRSRIDIRVTL